MEIYGRKGLVKILNLCHYNISLTLEHLPSNPSIDNSSRIVRNPSYFNLLRNRGGETTDGTRFFGEEAVGTLVNSG